MFLSKGVGKYLLQKVFVKKKVFFLSPKHKTVEFCPVTTENSALRSCHDKTIGSH